MNKAVFLDRDGTINVDKNYLYRIQDFEYLPEVKKALAMLQSAGYLLIVITNQSGIARGFYTERDYEKLNGLMITDLQRDGIEIAGTYFCPHHPKAQIRRYRCDCKCRKPSTGLFMQAVEDFDIELKASYAVGDKERDVAICMQSEAKGFVLYHNEIKQEKNITYIRGGLSEAADIIAAAEKKK